MNEQFWMVCCPDHGAPVFKHHSPGSATNEAERLARMHPGAKFYVLEAISLRCVDSMQRIDLRGFDSEIPF